MVLEDQLIQSLREKIGYTSAPSTNTEIEIDISNSQTDENTAYPPRVLGEMVITVIQESSNKVLAIGQIVNIRTENKWHSDITFKGVVKQYGTIPHLSGNADVRIATVSVQSSFIFDGDTLVPHVLGTSPSTGEQISVLTDPTMELLMQDKKSQITYLGKAYGAQVSIPFWFKHFGKDDNGNQEYGSGDAYHIGVFGKTGSGKTVMSAMMLLGYAKNKNNMSILILDPQSQFLNDRDLLPDGSKFSDEVKKIGMNHTSYQLCDHVYLSDDSLFSELLYASGFYKKAFRGSLGTQEKIDSMSSIITEYLTGRKNDPRFSLARYDKELLLQEMLSNFIDLKTDGTEKDAKDKKGKLHEVYVQKQGREQLEGRINMALNDIKNGGARDVVDKWNEVMGLFQIGSGKISVRELVKKIIDETGNVITLALASPNTKIENENLQAVFINAVQHEILRQASEKYEQLGDESNPTNALIVMDEAHRFASQNPSDPRIKELSGQIVDAVRTTRKYGVGYMFITQSLDSLHEELIRQMRIFSFGYGLTTGTELRKVREIINNDAALGLYRSFIDPGSNEKYPFMFYGPASPLSFTGAPVFVEAYKDFKHFEKGLKGEII